MLTENGTEVPGIAIVRSARGWARTLHRYAVDHGGAVVRTRPLEERQAIEDDYDVLIVDDISSFLNAHIVDEVHRRGRRILGVYDPEEFSPSGDAEAGRTRLERLNVDAVISSETTPEDFIRVIQQIAPVRIATVPAMPDTEDDFFANVFPTADPMGSALQAPTSFGIVTPTRPQPVERRKGHVTAVFGASGGSGVTEVGLELARCLGRRGEKTVFVDGDEMAPSLAQRLSLALHPNLRTAVDIVEHGTGRIPECLTSIATGLEVLVGIPHPRDWVEVRGGDLEAVVNELARGRHQVVVNASPYIEDLSPHGTDRFGVSRAVIAVADSIVLVCSPTPTSIARLIDRVADLAELADSKPIHVVVNRTPGNKFKKKEIAKEIERSIALASLHFIPADARVEKASWDGTLVPNGDFTRTINSSLSRMIPVTANIKSAGKPARSAKTPRPADLDAKRAARSGSNSKAPARSARPARKGA